MVAALTLGVTGYAVGGEGVREGVSPHSSIVHNQGGSTLTTCGCRSETDATSEDDSGPGRRVDACLLPGCRPGGGPGIRRCQDHSAVCGLPDREGVCSWCNRAARDAAARHADLCGPA